MRHTVFLLVVTLFAGLARASGPQESDRLTRIALGTSLLKMGQAAEARAHLEYARAEGPPVPLLSLALGQAYLACGEWTRAIDALEQARTASKGLPDVGFLLGVACFKAGRDLDAVRAFDQAGDLSPGAREAARYYRGLALARLGKATEARAQLRGWTTRETPAVDEEIAEVAAAREAWDAPEDVNDVITRPAYQRTARHFPTR